MITITKILNFSSCRDHRNQRGHIDHAIYCILHYCMVLRILFIFHFFLCVNYLNNIYFLQLKRRFSVIMVIAEHQCMYNNVSQCIEKLNYQLVITLTAIISERSEVLVDTTRIIGENHRLSICHWETFSHFIV